MSTEKNPVSPGNHAPMGIFDRLVREPLVHFLLLAAGLFLLQAFFAQDEREVIVVDDATRKVLFQQAEELRMRPLTRQEKDTVVQNYIEEEILLREARESGLADSPRIRDQLVQNMRVLITSDLREPGRDDLKSYFEDNLQRFTFPESLNLQHVSFDSADAVPSGFPGHSSVATGSEADTLAGIPPIRSINFMNRRRLTDTFGPDVAETMMTADPGDTAWKGPFPVSGGSIHYLRITGRNPERTPEFEEALAWLTTQWRSDKARELIEETVSRVRDKYLIEILPAGDAGNG